MKICLTKSFYDFLFITVFLSSSYKSKVKNFSLNFSHYFKGVYLKSKNHSHHIIPPYTPLYYSRFKHRAFNVLSNNIQAFFSVLPFYFTLVVSFSSLLALFFFFLHFTSEITHFSVYAVFITYFKHDYFLNLLGRNFIHFDVILPTNVLMMISFYTAIVIYTIMFVYSVYKFVIYIQREIRCKYLYSKIVHKQYLTGSILFILSEFMLFFSFFWAFFHVTLSPSIFIGCC